MPVRTLIHGGQNIKIPQQVKLVSKSPTKALEYQKNRVPSIDSPFKGPIIQPTDNQDIRRMLEFVQRHFQLVRENMMSPRDVPLDIIAMSPDYTITPAVLPLLLNQSYVFYNHQVPQGLKYTINRIEFFGVRLNVPVVPWPILCEPMSLAAWVFLFRVNGKNPVFNPFQFPNIGGVGTFGSEGFPFLSTEVFNPINNFGGFRFEVPEGSTITLEVKCQFVGGAIPAQFVTYGCRFRGFITSAKEQK